MAAFFFQVILLSLSGVMAPGPVTAIALERGKYSSSAGFFISLGHGLIEIPLMLLLFWGIGFVFEYSYVQNGIFLFGGFFLFIMAVQILKNICNPEEQSVYVISGSNVKTGMLLSLANPYFFIWWATIGTALILQAFDYGLFYFILFAAIHWTCDMIWLWLVSFFSHKTHRTFGRKFRVGLSVICAFMLTGFSVYFFYQFGRALYF